MLTALGRRASRLIGRRFRTPGVSACRAVGSRPPSDDEHPPSHNPSDSAEKLLNESRTPDVDGPPEFPSDVKDRGWQNYESWARSQMRHSYRPKGVDPAVTSIVLFPGQGSQFVGMSQKLLDYPNVKTMFASAARILGYDLLDLCLNGPREALDRTVHCQPAVFVTSLAAIEKLKAENPQAIENCIATAGFSIGEYAALVFAGSISFHDALKVVKIRAEAMQKASEATPSGMMTVHLRHNSKLNFACHTARRYCTEKLDMADPVCTVANFMFPECKVIAGHNEALEFVTQSARDFALSRIRPIPVSGAFHTSLMRPAIAPVSSALDDVDIKPPIIPVHANVTARRHVVSTIRKMLVRQLTKPVLWEQTLQVMYARAEGVGFPRTYEAGPGRHLGTTLKRTNLKAHATYKNIDV